MLNSRTTGAALLVLIASAVAVVSLTEPYQERAPGVVGSLAPNS